MKWLYQYTLVELKLSCNDKQKAKYYLQQAFQSFSPIKQDLRKVLLDIYEHLWPNPTPIEKQITHQVCDLALQLTNRSQRRTKSNSPFFGNEEGQIKGSGPEYKDFFAKHKNRMQECHDVYNQILNKKESLQKQSLPTRAVIYFNLANYWKRKGNLIEAISSYKQAINLYPKMAIFYQNLGNVYAKQQNWGRAILAYREAIKLNAHSPLLYRDLASALAQTGEIDEATNYYYYSVEACPKLASFSRDLKWLLKTEERNI
mgnify:CR=1 FL=1